MTTSGNNFSCHDLGGEIGERELLVCRAKDTAEHPTTRRTTSQNASSAEVEKPCCTLIKALAHLFTHLILIMPLGEKPGQYPHSSSNISL